MQQLLSVSDIIKKGWDLYTENFQKFLVPIAIMAVPYVFLYLLQIWGQNSALRLSLILSTLMFINNLWISIVLILLTDKIYKNENINITKLLEIAFSKIPSYFLVIILTLLAITGGFILLIIPGFIFMIWYGFATYINILEEKNNKGIKALKTSRELVKGRWGATFWRLIIPILVVYGIITIVVIGIIYMLTGGNLQSASFEQSVLINAVISAATIILVPLFATFVIILYNNLKDTKKVTATVK